MDSFDALMQAIERCSADQKQAIFQSIRQHISIHELEVGFNVRAEVILEAIRRASDLTQRGVRGIIAETTFALDVVPTMVGWTSEPIIGDAAYDTKLSRDNHSVRIQVKLQRKRLGKPMMRGGMYVVEVQRTRGGERDGRKTRPYRFGEFDLLAVCMEPSAKDWHAFLYASARALRPDCREPDIIDKFQFVPAFPAENDEIWTSDLSLALSRFTNVDAVSAGIKTPRLLSILKSN
jgi:hypothetical protein